jgi:flagellar basal-body rod protein FlgF
MPGGQYIALSAMQTRLDELDRLSADIANASTAGYKAERTSQLEADRPSFDTTLQTAIDVAGGERRLDMRTGAINPTGRDLDLAIEGSGFFTVQTPAGARYTRNGQFTRSTDGTLTTADGAAVMGTNGPINVGTSGGKISVDPDGTVRSGSDEAGKLAIVEFDDPAQLVRDGGAALRADGATPKPSTSPSVRSGSLEQSNVSVVERIAQLTGVARTFEALQKAVSLQMNDMDVRAIDQLGKR